MNLRDLKYLLALVEQRHFGKAAESCFVSQPALSMQIKKLEETLGVQLIERTNKSFLLTEVGVLIANHAREILQQVSTMQEVAAQAADPYSGRLSLGVIPTLAPYLLPHILPGLSETFPKLSIYLLEDKTSNLLIKLQQGKLDAALLALPISETETNFMVMPLFEEEFLLAVSKINILAKQKTVKHAALNDKTLLLLEDGHCMRDQALSFCQQNHAKEQADFRATSLETLRHMVASNLGITLMPKLSYRSDDNICYLPFNTLKPFRTIGLVCRESSAKKQLSNHIAKQIKGILSRHHMVKVLK